MDKEWFYILIDKIQSAINMGELKLTNIEVLNLGFIFGLASGEIDKIITEKK